MARRNTIVESSDAAGTSSEKPKREAKPTTVPKIADRKKAVAKPVVARPATIPIPIPNLNLPNPRMEAMKAQLEKLKADIATEEAKNEKLVADQAMEIEGFEREEEEAKARSDVVNDELSSGIAYELIKTSEIDAEAKKLQAQVNSQKELDETRELAAHYQTRADVLERWQGGNNGEEPRPWQKCELCLVRYGPEGDCVPKVLKCGHTMCTACVEKNIVDPENVKCPFDQKMTSFRHTAVPKNYTVLNM